MNATFLTRIIIPSVLSVLFLLVSPPMAQAQLEEPDVLERDRPATPLSNGYRNGLGFDVVLNNFGFGIGGQYSRVVGPYSNLTFQTGITGIRDVSEQSFQDFFTGQRIIPNKYNRALGFPFLIGYERRLFAEQIADNFRFFVAGSAGPALAFIYPYIDDVDDNGFRTFVITTSGLRPVERVNDFFSGWGQGSTRWGGAGEIKFGVSLGEDFKRQTTIEFGYFFYYFDPGIQVMEPFRPFGYDSQTGLPVAVNSEGERNPFFDPQKYFGTPQIVIRFGGMW